jgi:hypothetical protein
MHPQTFQKKKHEKDQDLCRTSGRTKTIYVLKKKLNPNKGRNLKDEKQ